MNEFGVSAEMLEKKDEVEGPMVEQDATPAIEATSAIEGEEVAQEAAKAKQKSKKAKKVD